MCVWECEVVGGGGVRVGGESGSEWLPETRASHLRVVMETKTRILGAGDGWWFLLHWDVSTYPE